MDVAPAAGPAEQIPAEQENAADSSVEASPSAESVKPEVPSAAAPQVDTDVQLPMAPSVKTDVAPTMDRAVSAAEPDRASAQPDEAMPATQKNMPPQFDEASAAQPVAAVPQGLAQPAGTAGNAPVVGGVSPVLGSPQAMELTLPDRDDAPSNIELSLRTPDTDAPTPSITAGVNEVPLIVVDDLPALVVNSADFTKSGEGPEVAVILIDAGGPMPTKDLLDQVPFPVSIAVDALAPDARARAQSFRAAGLEVLAIIGLPEGAQAQQVGQVIDAARAALPMSVGFLDVPSASFQASPDTAAQVVAAAGASGHGIVSFSRGENALVDQAALADQPAALVFRDIDGRDQDGAAIKRFMDQAAFRAGVDEGIVLLGRTHEDTLKALAEWSETSRVSNVEMVPLSFILTGVGTVAE
ncbi:MAG: divergent polysaccharide deacetylase family protein [Pacificibacter sp.]|uniref:divergent polysaccharide deacetylase family protein n=1 Tax=Pacificibacter sp. TaxID=1917866 RepID=UPI00321B5B66